MFGLIVIIGVLAVFDFFGWVGLLMAAVYGALEPDLAEMLLVMLGVSYLLYLLTN